MPGLSGIACLVIARIWVCLRIARCRWLSRGPRYIDRL